MGETLTKNGFAMPEPFFGAHQLGTELIEVRSTKIFAFASFEQIPHAFLRIQFWGVARQLLQMTSNLPGILRKSWARWTSSVWRRVPGKCLSLMLSL